MCPSGAKTWEDLFAGNQLGWAYSLVVVSRVETYRRVDSIRTKRWRPASNKLEGTSTLRARRSWFHPRFCHLNKGGRPLDLSCDGT